MIITLLGDVAMTIGKSLREMSQGAILDYRTSKKINYYGILLMIIHTKELKN